MPSLREIKDRIGSVRSTLKITSAMKLVASSKLRKAQKAVETLRPYSEALSSILDECSSENPTACLRPAVAARSGNSTLPVAIVSVSSNSSLCGAFNGNVIKKTLEVAECFGNVEFYTVGRKVTEAVKKGGYTIVEDLSDMVARPSYDAASELSKTLSEAFDDKKYSDVILVYNHFVSTARQEVVVESFLSRPEEKNPEDAPEEDIEIVEDSVESSEETYIFEPGRGEIENALRPKVLSLRIFSMILDSVAAEQAARTVAMQTATDNAQDLLSDLTLEYNKGRQQKITAEILDLVGGAAN